MFRLAGNHEYNMDDCGSPYSEAVEAHFRLAPGKEYRFGLNGGRLLGFVSEEGYPLGPVAVTFTTRVR